MRPHIADFAREVAGRFCDRCKDEEHVFPPDEGYSEWSHGVHERNGVTLNPMPCPAGPLWSLVEEIAAQGFQVIKHRGNHEDNGSARPTVDQTA